jgi:hypothetical protein
MPPDSRKELPYEEEKVVKVIRWLLDHNKIEPDLMNKLRWKYKE